MFANSAIVVFGALRVKNVLAKQLSAVAWLVVRLFEMLGIPKSTPTSPDKRKAHISKRKI